MSDASQRYASYGFRASERKRCHEGKQGVSSDDTWELPGRRAALQPLLGLAGEIYVQQGGYWVKVEACEVEATPAIPHGIRYSLTLHAPDGSRVLGFDNAHAIQEGRRRFVTARLEFDHWHPDGRVVRPYEFRDPARLLADFFAEVDHVLQRRGVIGR